MLNRMKLLFGVFIRFESANAAALEAKTALRKCKDKFNDELKIRDDEIEALRREQEDLRNKLCLCELEIEKLELQAQEYKNELQQWRMRANDNKEAVGRVIEENKELKEQYKNFFNDKEQKWLNLNEKAEEKCRKLALERGVIMRQCQDLSEESARMKDTLESQNAKILELRKNYNKILEENKLIRMEEEAYVKSYRGKIAKLEDVLKFKAGALEHLQLELKNIIRLKDHVRLQSTHLTMMDDVSLEDSDNVKCRLAAYEKKIYDLLMERRNHVLMMKRMRDFTGQLSKLCLQGDAESGSSIFSGTSDIPESSQLSSAHETEEPWYEPEFSNCSG